MSACWALHTFSGLEIWSDTVTLISCSMLIFGPAFITATVKTLAVERYDIIRRNVVKLILTGSYWELVVPMVFDGCACSILYFLWKLKIVYFCKLPVGNWDTLARCLGSAFIYMKKYNCQVYWTSHIFFPVSLGNQNRIRKHVWLASLPWLSYSSYVSLFGIRKSPTAGLSLINICLNLATVLRWLSGLKPHMRLRMVRYNGYEAEYHIWDDSCYGTEVSIWVEFKYVVLMRVRHRK